MNFDAGAQAWVGRARGAEQLSRPPSKEVPDDTWQMGSQSCCCLTLSRPLEASGPLTALMAHGMMTWGSPDCPVRRCPGGSLKRVAHGGAEPMDVTSFPSTVWAGQPLGAGSRHSAPRAPRHPWRTLRMTPTDDTVLCAPGEERIRWEVLSPLNGSHE